DTGSQIFSNPYSPFAYTPVSRQIAATYELVHRLGKDYEKPKWHLDHTTINGEQITVTEHKVLQKSFCDLIHFRRHHDRAQDDPVVLLIAPLSGHHATLLRDTVRALLPAHNVYVTDW